MAEESLSTSSSVPPPATPEVQPPPTPMAVSANIALSEDGSPDAVEQILTKCRTAWEMRTSDAKAAMQLAEDALRRSRLLPAVPATPAKRALAESLKVAGDCAWRLGDYALSEKLSAEARTHFNTLADKAGEAQALNSIGLARYCISDFTPARSYHEKSLALRRAIGDRAAISQSLNNIGVIYIGTSDYDTAYSYFKQALEIQRALNERATLIQTLNNLANIDYYKGNYSLALAAYRECLELARENGSLRSQLDALNNLGISHSDLGEYTTALENYHSALLLAQQHGDKRAQANARQNMGMTYQSMNELPKALSELSEALVIRRSLGDKTGECISLICMGTIHSQQKAFEQSFEVLREALYFAEGINDRLNEAVAHQRLGETAVATAEYDIAVQHFGRSLVLRHELDDKFGTASCLLALGDLYMTEGFYLQNAHAAREHYLHALELIDQLGAKELRFKALSALYRLYKKQGNLAEALTYLEQSNDAQQELSNSESRKKIAQLEVAHQTDQMRREQELTEKLLHNILPAPIAQRLKNNQRIIAERAPEVTVLFSDVVGFTPLSEKISPETLVAMLNDLFSLYDSAAERLGVEKIKTIGDAYMVVGGLPLPRPDHAEAIAALGLEMLGAVREINQMYNFNLGVRIGMHTGSVVAGVIGKKKLVYDIWGDAVNTASRMETHGAAGQIHVSAESYRQLRHKYCFESRGEIEVKGKGKMTTYFLTGLLPDHF